MAIEYTTIDNLKSQVLKNCGGEELTISLNEITAQAMESEERKTLLVSDITAKQENQMFSKAFQDAASKKPFSDYIKLEMPTAPKKYTEITIKSTSKGKTLPRFIAQAFKNLELALKKKTITNSMFCFGKSIIGKRKEPASDIYHELVNEIEKKFDFSLKDNIENIAAEVSAGSPYQIEYDAIDILIKDVERQIDEQIKVKTKLETAAVSPIRIDFGQALELALKGKDRKSVHVSKNTMDKEYKMIESAFEPFSKNNNYNVVAKIEKSNSNENYPNVVVRFGANQGVITTYPANAAQILATVAAKGLYNLQIAITKKSITNSIFCFGKSIMGKRKESAATIYQQTIKRLENKYKFNVQDEIKEVSEEVSLNSSAAIEYDAIDTLINDVKRQCNSRLSKEKVITIDFSQALELALKGKDRKSIHVSQKTIDKENAMIESAFEFTKKPEYTAIATVQIVTGENKYKTITISNFEDNTVGIHIAAKGFKNLQIAITKNSITNSIFCFGKSAFFIKRRESAADIYSQFVKELQKDYNFKVGYDNIDEITNKITSKSAPAIEYDVIDILTKEVMRQFKSDTTTSVTLPFGTALEKAMKGRNKKTLLVRKKSLENEANLLNNVAAHGCTGNLFSVNLKPHKKYIIPDIKISPVANHSSSPSELVKIVYDFFKTLSEQKSILNSIYFFGKSIIGKRKESASEIYEKAILNELGEKLPKTTTETTTETTEQ